MKREEAIAVVKNLVEAFSQGREGYVSSRSTYNETQLRVDFLNRLLEALGWDVFNEKQAPQHLREVVHEDEVEIEDNGEMLAKNPDYALRLGSERKMFVEAKRPSVAIATSASAAFQLRRYGWNARLPISVLTNFDKLVIYDCRARPDASDDAHFARIHIFDYTELVDKFDELYDWISREAVYSGRFDARFASETEYGGSQSFDDYFLEQIETWRLRLAQDIVGSNSGLSETDVNFLAQRILNRIIFLRICEDRALERYRALLEIETYAELKDLFRQADKRYDSGLFDFIEDRLSLTIALSNDVLIGIFRELYYPASPYAFSVVDTAILGEIYDRFLGKRLGVTKGQVSVSEKSEVVASRGVVPTPKFIVDEVVRETIGPLCTEKSPEQLSQLHLVDVCCGSGTFAVGLYDYLLNYYLEWYLQDGASRHPTKVFEGANNTWYLTLEERKRILTTHIYGVDIDPQAVEITRFSLLLKVLETVPASSISAGLDEDHVRALPNLDANIKVGNSLVDNRYFNFDPAAATDEQRYSSIYPLDWRAAFPSVFAQGGFDGIVGNPPYIRIQNMVHYSPQEVAYYQSRFSPYTCARNDNFDKYELFIERSLGLLKSNGRLGYIVPHKFFITRSGGSLRRLLAGGKHLSKIVHFGVNQVFGRKRTTYTCLLFVTRETSPTFSVHHVRDLASWRLNRQVESVDYRAEDFGEGPWEFVSPSASLVFQRLREQNPTPLKQVAEIMVGVQTSADRIYIVQPSRETADEVEFRDVQGQGWTIEKSILRRCLKDAPILPYGRPGANAWMIFPYTIQGRFAVPLSAQELASTYPKTWKYLNAHKAELLKRNIQGGNDIWYRFGRSQSLTRFDGTAKLIWPVLSQEPRYALDTNNTIFTGGGNGPYYGLRPRPTTQLSIQYLLAVLSHPAIDAMVRARASSFRGGYLSHGKQFIEKIPVRVLDLSDPQEAALHSGIVTQVNALVDLVDRGNQANNPNDRERLSRQAKAVKATIEDMVTIIYGLSAEDLAVVGITAPEEGGEG